MSTLSAVAPRAERLEPRHPDTDATSVASAVVSRSLGGFRDLSREHGFEPLTVEGRIPADLRGTLWRTGPALFSTFGRRYDHWFDGDGALYGTRFAEGRVEGAARLVETSVLAAERRAGRPLEGGYATPTPRRLSQLFRALLGRRVGKNASNTNVLHWQGRLYTLSEAGLPYAISPDDLATLGESDLGGIVSGTFTAHPHRAVGRASTWAFGLDFGRGNALTVYELPEDGPLRILTKLPLAFGTMIHDFAVTERHLVFFVSPLRLRMARLLLGNAGFAPSLAWEPERGTEVIVVPIGDPGATVRFHVPAFFQWHFAGSHDREDGRIVVDLVRYDDFRSNDWLAAIKDGAPGFPIDGRLHRATIDPRARTSSLEERCALPCEFPRTAPGLHDVVYAATFSSAFAACSTLPDRLVRIDVDRGDTRVLDLGPDRFPSEPVPVRKPGATRPDDAYLLAHVFDARASRTGVAVIDTARLDDGPIGWAWYDQTLPFTFHGGFVRD
ncbi:MAG: carotenoid oxygenase family protein [Deltaproteobacteria bacterium]|nr:carotenoid oxygenase family protein [Deltaproteobacteria bacterium]